MFPVGALYRQEMIHCPESIGRRWRIVYSSASLASLVAAVGAGLGVSRCRWAAASGPASPRLARRPLPPIAGLLSRRSTRGPGADSAPGAPPRPPALVLCGCTPGRGWQGER
ncbi:LysR substrate-binding domain-containing protein [Pseudomonas aeruginosa]